MEHRCWEENVSKVLPSRAPRGTQLFAPPGTRRHVSPSSIDERACAWRKSEHAQRLAPYIRGSGGGCVAARESRGSFLSVSGRLGAGDCWRGAWKLVLAPLRLLSRSGPLGSSLTPGELSLPPRCRPISRGRKMPSSAPTVSKAAGRAAQGRPEAWEVEGSGLWRPVITAASTPAVSRHGLPAQTGRGGKRGSGTVSPACLPWRPPDACVAGSLWLGEPSPRSDSLRLLRLAGCLGSPALPAAIWECRGGGNMAPSRGQCTREPRLHLPPGPGG